MELLVCLLLAMMIRPASDAFHAAKGIEPPHLSKARMAAARTAPPVAHGGPGRGTAGDVWDAYWGGAMADIAAHRDRVRAEKKAGVRPPLKERGKRLWRVLWDPIGEPKPEPEADKPAGSEPPANPNDQTPAPAEPAPAPDRAPDPEQDASNEGDDMTPTTAPNSPDHGWTGLVVDTLNGNKGIPVPGNSTGGTAMTSSATGDAHDLESASNQCELLDDDLTAINTSLDVIDERIDSAGNATELIEAFLRSKNMPDSAVGGMSVARDMLSPTHIKALMDAIAAAKQGVQAAKAAIDAMHDQASEALQGADGSVVNGR